MVTPRSFRRRIDVWLDGIESPNTRHAYRRDLGAFVAWLDHSGTPSPGVTTEHLAAFRSHCEASGASAATVRRRLAAVSSFYRDHRRGDVVNPAAELERPARPPAATHVLEPDDLGKLWDAALEAGGKTAVLLGLVLFDGFTSRGALAVDVEHVGVSPRAVTIAVGGVGRALDARSAAAVRRHVGTRTSGPLLLGDRTTGPPQRLTRFGVDYLVKQTAARAGVPGPVTVNLLRRSAGAVR